MFHKNETQTNFLKEQEEQKTKDFMREYQELCKKYNRILVPNLSMNVNYVNPPSGNNPSPIRK